MKEERAETIKTDVREYVEGYEVELKIRYELDDIWEKYNPDIKYRWTIEALNEGGYNRVSIDLKQLLRWVKKHKPELLED